jgi:hypothetical protein
MLNPDRALRDPGGPGVERLRFWRGQQLKSRDVNDAGAGEEERRWWHNRAVHDAYGVVAGLAVQPGTATEPGVRVHPGLAYDSYGREIVVVETVGVSPPGSAGRDPKAAWFLVLRAKDAAGCGGHGATGSSPGDLGWLRASRVGVADGVALARGVWVEVGEGLVFRADPGFSTLRARPFARPRLGRGHTAPGATAWRPWTEILGSSAGSDRLVTTARGIEVTIDTSAAGFARTPCYFAWLQGGLWQVPHRLALTVPLFRITREARDQLTFSLWDPTAVGSAVITSAVSQGAEAAIARLLSLARQRLYVCWLGIETDRHAALASSPGAAGLERAGVR